MSVQVGNERVSRVVLKNMEVKVSNWMEAGADGKWKIAGALKERLRWTKYRRYYQHVSFA
jgi:hypothetical protein